MSGLSFCVRSHENGFILTMEHILAKVHFYNINHQLAGSSMAITISNMRIWPYQQKDAYKAVFGGALDFTFVLPDEHIAGDSYCIGLDFEKVVYPPSRPLCAYSTAYAVERDDDKDLLSMNLTLNTSRFRDWVSKLKKPTPITLQLCRIRNGRCDTIVLDDLLALPSIVDGVNTVCPGDPLEKLLEEKLDKPFEPGTPSQVLSLDGDGKPVWRDEQEIPEQEQADWDQSDSSLASYIRNKPDISGDIDTAIETALTIHSN